ncbi:MAG: efflux RND transporter permease subunit, partial [Candidatus Pacebacteria bacterium]|nr:efflux RND transporter permease subunit [Candidatus Paceibacterota bacterium]
MWEFFIKNSKFSYLFLIALIGIGSYSLANIPKESAPEVIVPVGIISTALLGAPASDVESLITNEIERGLSSLENVKKITSTSREGFSSIVVEFEASADLDKSILDLKDEVDAIKQDLPGDAEDPVVSEVNFVDQPILTVAVSGNLADSSLTELSSKIEKEIETVEGVSRVETRGVRDREIAIIVNQESLERYGISLLQVTNAVQMANNTFPVGQIINDGVSYNVAFEGDINDSSQIKNIGVTTLNGQPVLISDIAIIEDGLAPADSLSRLSVGGEPSLNSITLSVYKQTGGDITTIASDVNKKLEELKVPGQILEDVTTVTVLDAGNDIKKDLVRLSGSGLQTVTLVILLLVLTLGWREGLLAGIAIPLSFLFGFIGLYMSGNTINFLSLFSLILGIGILVDSAIVMIEGINRKMKDNPTIDKREAAVFAIREFSSPLISGTLTTVSMFAGLFIVSGVTGQFISSIPFTLIFLLFASLFVSLAILPLIATHFLHRRTSSRFEVKQVASAHKLESWYRGKLEDYIRDNDKQNKFLSAIFALLVLALFLPINIFAGAIAAPMVYFVTLKSYSIQARKGWGELKRTIAWIPMLVVSIAASVILAGAILPSVNVVKVIFFDQSDVGYAIIEIENPEGTTKEVTDIAVRRVEEFLYQESEIDTFSVTVGSGSEFASGGVGEKYANIFINLNDDREHTSTEIVSDLREKFLILDDIKITVSQPSDGPPTGAAIIVKFLGDDLNEITTLANESAKLFRTVPGAINVNTSTNNNSTEFVLNLDKDKATAVGVSPFTISQTARTALYGTQVTSLTTLDEDIDVVVKLNIDNESDVMNDNSNVTSINALSNISIYTQTGPIPLSSLIDVSLRESSSAIFHEKGQRVVSVTADITADANVREVQAAAIELIENTLDIPSDVTLSTGGGETDESNKAFLEMILAMVIGIGLMVGILTLQFNSYLHMRYVLS